MTISATHEEIARYIGSAREVVTKVLKYFVQEGVVILERGKMRFRLKPDALHSLTRMTVWVVDCAVKVVMSDVLH